MTIDQSAVNEMLMQFYETLTLNDWSFVHVHERFLDSDEEYGWADCLADYTNHTEFWADMVRDNPEAAGRLSGIALALDALGVDPDAGWQDVTEEE